LQFFFALLPETNFLHLSINNSKDIKKLCFLFIRTQTNDIFLLSITYMLLMKKTTKRYSTITTNVSTFFLLAQLSAPISYQSCVCNYPTNNKGNYCVLSCFKLVVVCLQQFYVLFVF
jgi:hypothetical protein